MTGGNATILSPRGYGRPQAETTQTRVPIVRAWLTAGASYDREIVGRHEHRARTASRHVAEQVEDWIAANAARLTNTTPQ